MMIRRSNKKNWNKEIASSYPRFVRTHSEDTNGTKMTLVINRRVNTFSRNNVHSCCIPTIFLRTDGLPEPIHAWISSVKKTVHVFVPSTIAGVRPEEDVHIKGPPHLCPLRIDGDASDTARSISDTSNNSGY